MRFFGLVFLFVGSAVYSQCLTDLKKILPDRTESANFSTSKLALGGDYMVVGNSQDDSLGYANAGLAYLFQRSSSDWELLAVLKPSVPAPNLQFGYQVTMDTLGETVVVSAAGYSSPTLPSRVYIYQKPASGWTTMTETESFPSFEAGPILSAISISGDGLTLGVGEEADAIGVGGAWIYNRPNLNSHFSSQSPFRIPNPPNVLSFGMSISNDAGYFVVNAAGQFIEGNFVFVYKPNGDGTYALIANLAVGNSNGFANGRTVKIRQNVISAAGVFYNGQIILTKFLIFEKKPWEEWTNNSKVTILPVLPQKFVFDISNNFEILDSTHIALSSRYSLTSAGGNPLTGFVEVITKDAALGWQGATQSIIFEENLYPNDPYSTSMDWNGAQLVFTPTQNTSNAKLLNSVTSITYKNGAWETPEKIKVKSFVNSFQNYFGISVVRRNESLLVGSPYDNEAGPKAGAVLIYGKVGSDWVKTGKVLPVWESRGDTYFGRSVAATDSVMVVSAPNYSDKGKVIIYNRTGPTWSSFSQVQEITSPLSNLYNFGDRVALSQSILTVSAFDDAGPEGTATAMVIYEKINATWQFKQYISFHNSYLKYLTVRMEVKHDSIFVFTGIGGYNRVNTGVYIYTRNAQGSWVQTTSFVFPPLSYGFLGAPSQVSLAVGENHVFIGFADINLGNKANVGAVAVYVKPPGSPWANGNITSSSVLYSNDMIENGYFGYSVSTIDNTLIVGAPGTDTELIGNNTVPRNKAGATYIFTGKDYYWQDYEQLLKLEGSEYNKPLIDHMGFDVAVDRDYYFSGAAYETNEQGAIAGAVYTIPTAPLVKLIAPVCEMTSPISLFGYPFGGIWSGPGVSNGIFDPSAVGVGKYLLNYKTVNCTYQGKLSIEVLPRPIAALTTPTSVMICPTSPATIKVAPVTSASYAWYYKSFAATTPTLVAGQTQPQLAVGLSGYYFCVVTLNSCPASTGLVTVNYETPTASIGPQPIVCDLTKAITLTAKPIGGTWSGVGVTNGVTGQFNPGALSNGKAPVVYKFKSALGCFYNLNDSVIVDVVPKQTLNRSSDNFCTLGSIRLLVNPGPNNLNYSWSYKLDTTSSWGVIDALNTIVRPVSLSGSYQVTVRNTHCSLGTNFLKLNITTDLGITLTPKDSQIDVCMERSTQLSAAAISGSTFTWLKKDPVTMAYHQVGTGSTLQATESGDYKAIVVNGFCNQETQPQKVVFYPRDSVWVPNVFTPNGDGHNDLFYVSGNVHNYTLTVINRYGQEVFSGSEGQPWSGAGFPSGVYYWSVVFNNCRGEKQAQKGFVSLVL